MAKVLTFTQLRGLFDKRWKGPIAPKVLPYIDTFTSRVRIGNRIEAYVDGNYGVYLVSIQASGRKLVTSCSCPAGKDWGDCKHVIALAKTFIEVPASFPLVQALSWKDVANLGDIERFCRTNSIYRLVDEIRRRGITVMQLEKLLDVSLEDDDDSVFDFDEGEDYDEEDLFEDGLQSLEDSYMAKITCLWLLERLQKEELKSQPVKKKAGSGNSRTKNQGR